jgi:hypothetical protein
VRVPPITAGVDKDAKLVLTNLAAGVDGVSFELLNDGVGSAALSTPSFASGGRRLRHHHAVLHGGGIERGGRPGSEGGVSGAGNKQAGGAVSGGVEGRRDRARAEHRATELARRHAAQKIELEDTVRRLGGVLVGGAGLHRTGQDTVYLKNKRASGSLPGYPPHLGGWSVPVYYYSINTFESTRFDRFYAPLRAH